MSKRQIIACLMALCMLVGTFVPALAADEDWENPFTDVPEDEWYYEAVEYVNVNGLFQGTTATTFSPEVKMSRAMFVTVLGRAAEKLDEDVEGAEEADFTDMPDSEEYQKYISWASENEIVEGYPGNLFGPDDDVTREQMATLVVRFAEYMEIELKDDNEVEFNDADKISDWAEKGVEAAAAAGIINGHANGDFGPTDASSRAQVAQVFMNFGPYLETEDDEKDPDDYAYEAEYLWYEETENFNWDPYPKTAYEYFEKNLGGSEDFDLDAFVTSELGEKTIIELENYILYSDEMHEDVVAYWADLGLKKELHDGDTDDRWATYVPLSAEDEENAEEVYPVVFAMHGGSDPIFIVESYGIAQVGAKEEYITVMPQTLSTDECHRILDAMEDEGYPIDRTRVYATGFSNGGFRPQLISFEDPTLFAAIAPGGQNMLTYKTPMVADKTYITDDERAALTEAGMPILNYNGTMESIIRWPLSVENALDTGEGKIEAFNSWLTFSHSVGEELTMEKSEALSETSEDIVKKTTGIDFTDTETLKLDGTNYHVGDFYNEDGVNTMRVVAIEGMNHWPAPSSAQLAWDFCSQFYRDADTGAVGVID